MGEIAIFTEKPAGLSIFAWYDRLCEWFEMQAEKQERKLEFDLEITRAIAGDSVPAVVAAAAHVATYHATKANGERPKSRSSRRPH